MCDKCDGKLLLMVGEIKGTVEELKNSQTIAHQDIKDLRQKDIKELRDDLTTTKIKTYGFAAILGGIFGFLTKFIP